MQAVFRFVPDEAGWAVDDFGVDFLAPVGRQAVQEFRAAIGEFHQLVCHRKGLEDFEAAFGVEVAHRDEGVGDHDIGAGDGFLGGLEQFDPALQFGGDVEIVLVRRVAVRRADGEGEAELGGGVDEAGADIVAIPDPGEAGAPEGEAVFFERHQVGHDLAGVRAVRQAVDDRHAGGLGEGFDVGMVVGADHHGVDIARQDAGGVLDGLAAAELHVAGGGGDRAAAELAHRHVEGEAGAGGGLLEDHREGVALERSAGIDAALGPAGAGFLRPVRLIEDRAQLRLLQRPDVEKVADRHGRGPRKNKRAA